MYKQPWVFWSPELGVGQKHLLRPWLLLAVGLQTRSLCNLLQAARRKKWKSLKGLNPQNSEEFWWKSDGKSDVLKYFKMFYENLMENVGFLVNLKISLTWGTNIVGHLANATARVKWRAGRVSDRQQNFQLQWPLEHLELLTFCVNHTPRMLRKLTSQLSKPKQLKWVGWRPSSVLPSFGGAFWHCWALAKKVFRASEIRRQIALLDRNCSPWVFW